MSAELLRRPGLWLATALALAPAAHAQTAEPAPPEQPPTVVEPVAPAAPPDASTLSTSPPDAAAPAPASEPTAPAAGELLDLDLRQLSELTVTSVSRKAEPLNRAPAAVYVITADQIRRSGARTLPELLRNVPGLHVSRVNSRVWAISARGFTSETADKLEVLQDGRTLYTPLFSGVRWDEQGYALADIDRIEIIRGPDGTLWGANAVNGVINIITKAAAATQGGQVSATSGGEYDDVATARYGFAPFGAAVRGYVRHQRLGGTQLVANHEGAFDGWDQLRGGLRGDWSGWTLQADAYRGGEQDASHGGIDAEGWTAQLGKILDHDSGRQEQVQAYWLHTGRDLHNDLGEQRNTANFDFQQHVALGWGGDLVWGAGYQRSSDDLRNGPTLVFDPDQRTVELFSGFLQDDFALGENLSLTVGSKLEHNSFTGFEYQPDARLAWVPSERTTLWGAVSRAVRTPNRFEQDATSIGGGAGTPEDASSSLIGGTPLPNQVPAPQNFQQCVQAGGDPAVCAVLFPVNQPLPATPKTIEDCVARGVPQTVCAQLFPPADSSDLRGNRNFKSEKLLAFELGWRQQLGERVSLDTAVYYNRYDDLRGLESDGGNDVRIANALQGTAFGGEVFAAWQPGARWQVRGGYSYLHLALSLKPGAIDNGTKARQKDDPRHEAFVTAAWQATERWAAQANVRYVDALRGLSVPSYADADLGLSWDPFGWLHLDVQGRNLLHADHQEFGGRDASLIAREVYLTLRAGF